MKKKFFVLTLLSLVMFSTWLFYQYLTWNTLPELTLFPVATKHSHPDFKAQIDSSSNYLKIAAKALNAPSVSVAVGIQGDLIWSETIGFASLKDKVQATPETLYRAGGASKLLTAAAVLLLEERGRIELNHPVNSFLNELPAQTPEITMVQLLSHTSGIGNHNDHGLKTRFISTCDCIQFNTVDEALPLFATSELLFTPGTQYSYSTYGYIASSKVIEEISGTSFLSFLDNEVFAPLNMIQSYGDHAPNIDPDLHIATSYEVSDNSYRKWRTFGISDHTLNLSYNWAGGGMLSTPTDLTRFGNAILTNKLFQNAENSRKLLTPMPVNGKDKIIFGWNSNLNEEVMLPNGKIINMWLVSTSGRKKGVGTSFLMFPEIELVIAVSVNGSYKHWSNDTFINESLKIAQPFIDHLLPPTVMLEE